MKNPNIKMNQLVKNHPEIEFFYHFLCQNKIVEARRIIKELIIKTVKKLNLENIFIDSEEDYLKNPEEFCNVFEEISRNIKPIPDIKKFMDQMCEYMKESREKIETENKIKVEEFWNQIEPYLYEGTWFVDHL